MKFIPIGLHCSVPDGIKKANLREYSYPFDWLWTPSKTTYEILYILINNGIDEAIKYMTTNYTYYKYLKNEHYESVQYTTECQMNKITGLGNTHFTINTEYKNTLRRRLTRLLEDIQSNDDIYLIYADAANEYLNYYLDDVEYGVDATAYLLKIHTLISSINKNIKVLYFCWNKRQQENNIIQYIPFNFKNNWYEVSDFIKIYLLNLIHTTCK